MKLTPSNLSHVSHVSHVSHGARILAGALMLCWMCGFLLCHAECHVASYDCHPKVSARADQSHAPCHSSDPDRSSPGKPGSTPCCCSLEIMQQEIQSIQVSQSPVLLEVAFFAGAADAGIEVGFPGSWSYGCQAKWRDWMLTPALSLGPAVHSQAPPSMHCA